MSKTRPQQTSLQCKCRKMPASKPLQVADAGEPQSGEPSLRVELDKLVQSAEIKLRASQSANSGRIETSSRSSHKSESHATQQTTTTTAAEKATTTATKSSAHLRNQHDKRCGESSAEHKQKQLQKVSSELETSKLASEQTKESRVTEANRGSVQQVFAEGGSSLRANFDSLKRDEDDKNDDRLPSVGRVASSSDACTGKLPLEVGNKQAECDSPCNDESDEATRATSALGELPRLLTSKCHALLKNIAPRSQQAALQSVDDPHSRRSSSASYKLPALLNQLKASSRAPDSSDDSSDSELALAVSASRRAPLSVSKLSQRRQAGSLRFNLRASASSPSSLATPSPPPPDGSDARATFCECSRTFADRNKTPPQSQSSSSSPSDEQPRVSEKAVQTVSSPPRHRSQRRRSTITAALQALRLASNTARDSGEGAQSPKWAKLGLKRRSQLLRDTNAGPHRRRTNSSPCGELTSSRARSNSSSNPHPTKKGLAGDLLAASSSSLHKKRNSLINLLSHLSAEQTQAHLRKVAGKAKERATQGRSKREGAQQLTIPETGFRVVVMGGARVGKTSIVTRFLYDSFDAKHTPTVEDNYFVEFPYNKNVICIDIADTSGKFD